MDYWFQIISVDALYLSSSVQINAGAGFTYILEERQSLDELLFSMSSLIEWDI